MNFFKGIIIGLGAIAPGLSGSVLLVLFGLYQNTITAISTTVKAVFELVLEFFRNIKNLKALRGTKALNTIVDNIKYLVPLVLGIGIGVLLFSKLVDFLLENYEMQTRFAFLGFILGSLPLFYKEVKKEGFNKKYYGVMAISLVGGAILFNLKEAPNITEPNILQSMVLGLAVATSYIVPGVDSAAILSALGLYELWVSSIADLNFGVLIPAAVGLAVGVLAVSFLINKLIEKYYTLTFSIIFGMFISIIPKVLNESCVVGLNLKTAASIGIMIACFCLSLLFSNLEKIKEKREKNA